MDKAPAGAFEVGIEVDFAFGLAFGLAFTACLPFSPFGFALFGLAFFEGDSGRSDNSESLPRSSIAAGALVLDSPFDCLAACPISADVSSNNGWLLLCDDTFFLQFR